MLLLLSCKCRWNMILFSVVSGFDCCFVLPWNLPQKFWNNIFWTGTKVVMLVVLCCVWFLPSTGLCIMTKHLIPSVKCSDFGLFCSHRTCQTFSWWQQWTPLYVRIFLRQMSGHLSSILSWTEIGGYTMTVIPCNMSKPTSECLMKKTKQDFWIPHLNYFILCFILYVLVFGAAFSWPRLALKSDHVSKPWFKG